MIKIEKLSEKTLNEVLKELFPEGVLIPQFRLKIDNKTYIVDYCIKIKNDIILFEFDGPTHYQNTKTQIRDICLEDYCIDNYLYLVRIPYFMQIDISTLNLFFDSYLVEKYNLNIKMNNIQCDYISGFYDNKIIYPADWNSFGWSIFWEMYKQLNRLDLIYVMRQIYDSLDLSNENVLLKLGIDFMTVKSKKDFYQNYPT